MKYYIATNKTLLDLMNQRGFPLGSKSFSWCEVIKHPLEEKWAALISDELFDNLHLLLKPEEIEEINNNLYNTISDDWFTNKHIKP